MLLRNTISSKSLIFKASFFNHYKTLNVSSTASQEQIKNSYLQLAKKYHPDLNSNNENNQEKENVDFIKIKQAYDVLKERNSRRIYDLEMFPQNIEAQTQNFYYYRAHEFEQNHQRRKKEQKDKINFILKSFLLLGVGIYWINTIDLKQLLRKQQMHVIRRQNIILQRENIEDGPAVQQRRKQQYAQEMKDKKIYGVVVQLKVRGAGEQTTKAKQKRKQGITSIQGIQKQNKQQINLITPDQEYM